MLFHGYLSKFSFERLRQEYKYNQIALKALEFASLAWKWLLQAGLLLCLPTGGVRVVSLDNED